MTEQSSAAHLRECRPDEGWCAEGCPRYPMIEAALRPPESAAASGCPECRGADGHSLDCETGEIHMTTCAIEATGFCTCERSAAKSPVAGERAGGATSARSTSKPIASVRWLDSSLQNGQVDKDDFPKPCVITSVGFVVEDTAEHITLARDDMGHDGDYRGLVAIPRVAVLHVKAAQ